MQESALTPAPDTAGSFPCVQCRAAELPLPLQELFTKVCSVQDGPDLDGKPAVSEAERRLKVADLNKTLDELTKPDNKKSPILRELVTMCSPRMMFWITKIILKDMKVSLCSVVCALAARPKCLRNVEQCWCRMQATMLRTEGQAEQSS